MKKLCHSLVIFTTVGVHTIFVSLVLWETPQTKQTRVYCKRRLFVFLFLAPNFGSFVSLVHCTECVPCIVCLPTQVLYQSSGESCPLRYLPLTVDKHSVDKPAAPVSVVGPATGIIFVMTKHVYCRDKSMLVATNIFLSRQT